MAHIKLTNNQINKIGQAYLETLLTAAQAAELIGVAVPTITKWVQQGRLIPAYEAPAPNAKVAFRLFAPAEVQAVPQNVLGRPWGTGKNQIEEVTEAA